LLCAELFGNGVAASNYGPEPSANPLNWLGRDPGVTRAVHAASKIKTNIAMTRRGFISPAFSAQASAREAILAAKAWQSSRVPSFDEHSMVAADIAQLSIFSRTNQLFLNPHCFCRQVLRQITPRATSTSTS